MDADADALISVDELALRWRTSVAAVVVLVENGTIPSLDGGRLAGAGTTDVPLLRPSWAELVRVDSPGAVRRMDLETTDRLHPAASTAIDLHHAVSKGDEAVVWQLSSLESTSALKDGGELLHQWQSIMGDVFASDVGLATGVYALVPERGVGVRLIAGIGPHPEVYSRPTPQAAIGIFVLIEQEGRWVADTALTDADIDYLSLVRSAPPAGWSPSDGALS